MNDKRINRISEEVKKVIADLIINDIKDPRISKMASINKVVVTKDLKYAKIYVSVLGNEMEKEETLKGLESAKGYIRKAIGDKINLRITPEPIFYIDDSIEQAIYMTNLIKQVSNNDNTDGKNGDQNNE
ncbi:MAG: 30S ribosome-binding factor RbfA [Tissierellales bacterium]|jgi:ribosome-binding factor A|nr:30S ribosome-binding factor RbfA [Tissierellales bacterium]